MLDEESNESKKIISEKGWGEEEKGVNNHHYAKPDSISIKRLCQLTPNKKRTTSNEHK